MTWMVLGQQPIAFRVNTDIYEDETKPPIRTTETLFFEGCITTLMIRIPIGLA